MSCKFLAKLMFLGYAIIQLPEILVSMYAFIRKQFIQRTAKILDTRSRTLYQIKPFREENWGYDVMNSIGAPFLEAVENRILKSEIKILDVVEKKLDCINNRIDDVMSRL